MFLARSEISAPYRPRGFPKVESVRAGDHRGERENLQPVLVTDFVFFEPPGIRGGVVSRYGHDHEFDQEDLRSTENAVVVKPLPLGQSDQEREHSQERSHSREREPVGRYRLSQDELETLRDIGKFRVVRAEDLQRFRYEGNGQTAGRDLESLRAQGLVRRCALLEGGKKSSLVVLTKEGMRLLHSDAGLASGQTVYAGLVKRREVAAENGLEVVNGKIPLPDLRIEYQTRDGELAKVDLELATDHYKASRIAEKARAGFVVCSEGGGTKPEDRDFMSEILSL
jgi:hypothetical protein